MATRNDYLLLAELGKRILSLRRDPRAWIEANLQIRTKDRRIIPFHFNRAQAHYYGHRTARDIILKARQMGVTTLVGALFFADCLLRPNTTSVLAAHDLESAERIFRIIKLLWERLPGEEKARAGPPRYENRRELVWPKIGSSFFVGTAGSIRFGHGLTINNLHCSEVSRWSHPEDSLVALLEAVPPDGRVILESTANGAGNYFHTLWTDAKQGRSGFTPHFYVWWEDPAYRIPGPDLTDPSTGSGQVLTAEERDLKERFRLDDSQIRWRREKQTELRDRFREQYPEDDVTCFLTSGRCCFDVETLRQVLQAISREPGPRHIASLSKKEDSVSFAPAQLLVWQYPKEGRTYVIGADVGEGLSGGDASCAQVMDRESCEQVAELHGRVPPDRFAYMLSWLGRWYKMAVLGVERNNHGHSTLNTLRNVLRYPRLYYHVRYDVTVRRAAPILGWPTDQSTKPILVDDLAAAIAGGQIVIHSPALVDECLTFVTTDTGEQRAQEGKFDDRVMAAGIAWQVRKRRQGRFTTERPEGW